MRKTTGNRLTWLWLTIAFVGLLPAKLSAHAMDQSYIYLRVYQDRIEGRYEITPADLNKLFGLNLSKDMTLEDIKPHLDTIYAYYQQKAGFASPEGPYTVLFTEPSFLETIEMGKYAQFNFKLEGQEGVPDELETRYEVLFDEESGYSGFLMIEYNWKAGIYENEGLASLTYTPLDREQSLDLTDGSVWTGVWALIKSGIWHIFIGLDHILFLLALVLPSVVRYQRAQEPNWTPVEAFRPAFIYILKIVTLFTLAHTVTLSLAALEIVVLPSRLVESIIALSIALAAFHNIRPLFDKEELMIAFGFGLFHGFGFASVMGEIGLSGEYTALSLFGFNVGVELGQIMIICVIFPILFFIRKARYYPRILVYGSILLIFISLYWFVERAFDIDIPLGRFIVGIFG